MRRAAQASLLDDPETICAFLQTMGCDLEIFEGDQSFIITRQHDTVLNTCPGSHAQFEKNVRTECKRSDITA